VATAERGCCLQCSATGPTTGWRPKLHSGAAPWLKAISHDQQRMRIPAILSQEITNLASNHSEIQRCAPLLTETFPISTFDPQPFLPLAHGRSQGQLPVGINGVPRTAQKRLGEAPVGRECRSASAVMRDGFAGITADKEPLTRLTLQLDNV